MRFGLTAVSSSATFPPRLTVLPRSVGRLSVVSVSAMVHKFKDTKLSSVALKSDKVSARESEGGGGGGRGSLPLFRQKVCWLCWAVTHLTS